MVSVNSDQESQVTPVMGSAAVAMSPRVTAFVELEVELELDTQCVFLEWDIQYVFPELGMRCVFPGEAGVQQ
jgi:hypothetical protein